MMSSQLGTLGRPDLRVDGRRDGAEGVDGADGLDGPGAPDGAVGRGRAREVVTSSAGGSSQSGASTALRSRLEEAPS